MGGKPNCAVEIVKNGSRGSVFQTGLPFRQESGGFENPRLLRDRPSDGAAWVAKIIAGVACRFMRVYTGIERRCEQVAARALLGREGMILCAVYAVECSNGHAGQSFRLACLSGKNPGV